MGMVTKMESRVEAVEGRMVEFQSAVEREIGSIRDKTRDEVQ